MRTIIQSTPRELTLLMVQDTDGKTGVTGLTLTVTVRKAGSSTWTAAAGATVDRGFGRYGYTPTAGEVNTLGDFEIRAVGASARDFNGLWEIDVARATAAAVTALQTDMTTILARIDVTLSTRATPAQVSAGTVAGVAGNVSGSVGSVTGNVGGNVVGSVASVTGGVGGNVAGSVASVTGNVGGNVTGSVASVTAPVAVASIATDAVSALSIAAAAVSKIQSGLATSSALASVGTDATTAATQATTAATQATTAATQATTAATQATTAATQATASAVSAASVDNKLTSQRAGYLDAAITSRAPSTLTDASIAAQVDTVLTNSHGSGSWLAGSGGASASAIADAVWDEILSGHLTAGTTGAILNALTAAVAAVASSVSGLASSIAAVPAAAATSLLSSIVESTGSDSYTVNTLYKRVHAFVAGNAAVPGATDGSYIMRALDGATALVTATIASGVRTITSRGG